MNGRVSGGSVVQRLARGLQVTSLILVHGSSR